MPAFSIITVLQVVVALGLLNVWLLRSGSSTPYRGGDSNSLKAEFGAYGLPSWFFYLVGFLKIGSAIALLAAVWVPSLLVPAAGVVVALMLGALGMHLKVKDPALKSLPAFAMLAMSVSIVALVGA